MEVICLETDAFYELVEEVVQRVSAKNKDAQLDKWISGEEAMKLLRISSPTTLAKMRNEGKIRYSQPSKKIILYDRDSINSYLDNISNDTFLITMKAIQHEIKPSEDYIKGFNHGYNLQRYEPEMVRTITKGIRDKNSDYAIGIQDGKAEMILEMEREKYPNKKTIPSPRKDIDLERDR